ncbi:unnamed protein product [Notodromas monacha]|uniref:Uncharacterized protein n=1 Tax=Notodromas monacha TaxID=399045 RepID=A0A7R9BNX5_9CRUS|nr:unnamed protein product [Notodromas monacha]CAG0917598.1 unnamed protein product [Notodromas monacha]
MAPNKKYDVALIYQVTETELKKEWDNYETKQRYDTAYVCKCVFGGTLDYPKIISKGSKDIIDSWEMVALTSREAMEPVKPGSTPTEVVVPELLPGSFEAEYGKDGWLKKKFVKPLEEACKLLHTHIMKMNDAIMEAKRIRHLYVLISTSAIIRNRLWFYSEKVDKEHNKPILDQYARFRSLVEILLHEAMDYHANLLQKCVLIDPHGLDWTNNTKNEKLSDHVIFWWCHMRAVRADLWQILPPRLAQDIFSAALMESLSLLSLRYSQTSPSFERLTDFRADVMGILLLSSEMVLSICSSLRELVENPEIQQKVPFCIGLRCQLLLLVATVVGCPIDLLQTFIKKTKGKLEPLSHEGMDEASEHSNEARTIQTPLNFWLTAVRPDLYPSSPHYASSGNLISSSDPPLPPQVLYFQISFLAAQPRPQWHLILQVLISQGFGISGCLYASLERQEPTVKDWYSLQEIKELNYCKGCLCSLSGCCNGESKLTTQDIYSALTYILVHVGGCDDDVLMKTMLPAIRNKLDMQVFDKSQVWNAVRPHWLQALIWVMEPYLVPVFQDAIAEVRRLSHVDDACMETLMKIVLTNLHEITLLIPASVRKFICALQTTLTASAFCGHSVNPLCGNICIHLLVNAIFTLPMGLICLGEFEPELDKTEAGIISNLKETLCRLSEDDREITFSKEIDKIRNAFSATDEKSMNQAHKFAMLKKLDVWSCGEEVAQILHNTLSVNVNWARQILGISPPYMMDQNIQSSGGLVIPSWEPFRSFNPFDEHRLFQGIAFHQGQLREYPMNWDLVLAFVFTPLSRKNAQTLLKLRPELNSDESLLDEDTKRCVDYLKRHYCIENLSKTVV